MREKVHETLVEVALYVGYAMGENQEFIVGDSREFVEKLSQKCHEFESNWKDDDGAFLDAVDRLAEATLQQFRNGGLIKSDTRTATAS